VQGGCSDCSSKVPAVRIVDQITFTNNCIEGAWTHYYALDNQDDILFSIKNENNTTAYVVDVRDREMIKKGSINDTTYIMGRNWNVDIMNDEELTEPVSIRFYFEDGELQEIIDAAAAFQSTDRAIHDTNEWEEDIEISPNPASDAFVIQMPFSDVSDYIINVFDTRGTNIETLNVQTNSIQFGHDYDPGVYQVVFFQFEQRLLSNGQSRYLKPYFFIERLSSLLARFFLRRKPCQKLLRTYPYRLADECHP